MKKALLIIFTISSLLSCNQNDKKVTELKNKINKLEQQIENSYKPGLGDMMSNIQSHHSKLWFSGKNENWELADFELHELKEGFEDVKKHQAGNDEIKMIGMIVPALENLDISIDEKDLKGFEKNYLMLTNTCNACHKIAKHGFIQIKKPQFQSRHNQEFKKLK
jgi:hypothetical protein